MELNEWLLRPDVIFLNHGSFGACPRPVFEEYQRWQLELERQPVEFLGRRFTELMRGARVPLAQYVNCDPDDLVYVPNATTGLNVVARALPLEPGDEVLATDHEYGALDRTWRFVCARRGAVYRRLPVPVPVTTAEDFVERFWSGVTPRTRVIFLSHITSPTALVLPIREIVRRAREAGIVSVIDGAHAAGQIPLDLAALGADFYSSNAHKWMLTPKGSAFLYARRAVQSLIEPLVVSWGWQSDHPGASRFIDEQEWQGTRDISAYLTVPSAIQFMHEHDWARVREDCHALARYAREQITAITGLEPLSPETWDGSDEPGSRWYAQMVSLPLPPGDPDALKRGLYDKYNIEAPIISWNDRRLIRVSIQNYNTRADVDALAAALGSQLTAA